MILIFLLNVEEETWVGRTVDRRRRDRWETKDKLNLAEMNVLGLNSSHILWFKRPHEYIAGERRKGFWFVRVCEIKDDEKTGSISCHYNISLFLSHKPKPSAAAAGFSYNICIFLKSLSPEEQKYRFVTRPKWLKDVQSERLWLKRLLFASCHSTPFDLCCLLIVFWSFPLR